MPFYALKVDVWLYENAINFYINDLVTEENLHRHRTTITLFEARVIAV